MSIVLSFLATLACLFWLLKSPLASRVLDTPNHRSLHTKAIPRTGGVGIMAVTLVSSFFFPIPWQMQGSLFLLLVVSLWDDVHAVAVKWRLLAHFAAAIGLAVALKVNAASWLGVALAVPATVWMINLYNFMDGSDGLAGGMALFGFSAYGIAAGMAGMAWAPWSFVIAAAAAAFLCFNFPPAKMFMGDGGSVPLGYLAAVLGGMGWQAGIWPLWFPVLVFSPFIADATVTLAKRFLRGEKIWQAHREHYYQRVVLMGAGHLRVALGAYVLMVLAAISALWGMRLGQGAQLILVVGWVVAYGSCMMIVDRLWVRHLQREGRC